MKYVVDISKNQAEKIERLIENGKYNSIAQFVSTAITNQVYLEGSDEDKLTNTGNALISKKVESSGFKNLELKDINPVPVPLPELKDIVSSVPRVDSNKISNNFIWLWGQINRVFPIKLGLRVLFNMINNDQWVELEEFREEAAKIASNVSYTIKEHEYSNKVLKQKRISTGLPEKGKYKSLLRYKSHFLANLRSDDLLDGAMVNLRFVNLKRDTKSKILIGLTKPGIEFSKLINPIMDKEKYNTSLNNEEIKFYIEHIKKYVPGENYAINWLLKKITSGVSDRTDINRLLKEEIGYKWKSNNWKATDKFVNTQRAGLMARMFDLNLIVREKKGIEVVYKISDFGREFIDNV